MSDNMHDYCANCGEPINTVVPSDPDVYQYCNDCNRPEDVNRPEIQGLVSLVDGHVVIDYRSVRGRK
jgi:hypothetical protein